MIFRQSERGFVLATSLVMLLLMSLLTAVVLISVESAQQGTASAQSSTEAFYYAETGANYVSWALYNDAEFDSFTYPSQVKSTGERKFSEPEVRPGLLTPMVKGDFTEWVANRGNPSGDDYVTPLNLTGIGGKVYGQVMYYDNSPAVGRALYYMNGDMYSQSVSSTGLPEMFEIYKQLPRYIMVSIDSDGNITPSMPPFSATSPHHGDVMGVDYPENGAVAWVTGGSRTDDYVLDPVDNENAAIYDPITGAPDPFAQYASLAAACDPVGAVGGTKVACSPTAGWLNTGEYGLVIYSVGFVRGKAQKIIRVAYVE